MKKLAHLIQPPHVTPACQALAPHAQRGVLNLIVLVSGGHDSTSLLWALHQISLSIQGSLSPKWHQYFDSASPKINVMALHCNHKTRGTENEHEQQLIVDLCLDWGVPIKTVSKCNWDPNENFQDQARAWRLEQARIFADSLEQNHLVCMAHHARDVAETMLLNICRGTGLKGLTCLPEWDKNQRIFRPLVSTLFAELQDYALSQNLRWSEDSSNAKLDYSRNRIRHEVLPCFEKLNPSYEKAFLTLQQNLRNLT